MGRLIALVALFFAEFCSAAEIAVDTGHTLAKPGTISASGASEFDLNRKFVHALERQLRIPDQADELLAYATSRFQRKPTGE